MTSLNESINFFSDYRLEENGITLFEPCFCITLFSSEVVTKEHAPESLLTPYRVFWDDFGSQIDRIRYDGNQSHGVKVNDKNLRVPYDWLSNIKERFKGRVSVDLYAGTHKMERRLPRLDWEYNNANPEVNRPSHSSFRIFLPLSWLAEQKIEGVEAYIRHLTGDFPFSCGYAGFALCFNDGEVLTRKDLKAYLKQWLGRHPGIMPPDPRIESLWVSKTDGIASLGWITLLSAEFCNRMGGIVGLQQKLSAIPDVHMMPFVQQGAIIRIGEAPLLGDTLHNDYLESYRAVAQVLQPFNHVAKRLATDHLHVTGIDGKEERKKWFTRFFESQDK